ncbi:MAG: chromosome segregation SMC family protein, partial [Ancalomicrobiaceae bacterium]|nr:chromosome segregation SMC family protein [Ancalomicrobiaceae bacterium]
MKFTKLRLSGFKSFVEPTEFLIEPGLTGVVGPNGCGKSNLVEALRWVMGENSYKNMRASGMDDVIFSGSGKRPSRNTAEVALHLDNSARTAPAGFNESDQLEVSRRIEREVGSVYRINSRDVRARDVQLLFADASTGSRSPSMVRQGQIGELIAAKPASRRAILEEASGISGLHSRRQEAETRLKAAETNLDRLEDVLSGIETQIEGLGRQARQASRYRHLSADIRSGEAAIAHMRWSAARGHIAETEQALAEADATVIDRAGRQARAARDAAVGAQALPGLREAEAREAAGLQRLKLALSELDAEERRVKERLSDLARRLAQLAEDRSREERMAGDMAEALTRLEAEEQDLAEGDLETQALTEELNERVVTAEAEAGEAERLFASLQAEAAGLEARRHELTRAAEEAVARQRSLEAQAATVMTEKQALTERIEATRDDDEASMRLETATEAVVAAEDLVAATEEEALTRRAALETARAGLATAEREVDRLEAEARALEKMLAGEAKSAMPPLIDAITVKAGYETALGAALGDDLDVTTDTGAPIHWSQPGPGDADPPLPAGATPLSEVISGPAVMARRLAQIGLVAAADGARLQLQLKSGQRLVSRNGDLWRWDGLSAKADAPTAAARRLGARNRLVEIASDGTVARDRLS